MFLRQKTARDEQRGFSLIEFSVVLLISGFIFAGAMSVYVVYAKRVKLETTYDNLYAANTLMTEAWNLNNRYFCPADPTLQPGDANYGRENCAAGLTTGTCTGGADGVCVGAGLAAGAQSSDVLVGMFPFLTVAEEYADKRSTLQQAFENEQDPDVRASIRRTIEAGKRSRFTKSSDMAYDGWGQQFTYTVSRALTVQSQQKSVVGSIEVINAANNSDSRRGVHFALLSHGENKKGARNREGKFMIACDDPSLSDLERENCNNDGRILRPAVFSKGLNANEADDIVAYNSYIAQELWRTVPCDRDGNAATVEFCIRNVNPGNVGVGEEGGDIDEKLTVDGQMRADQVITGQICDANGQNCFSPSYIGGEAFAGCSQEGLPPNKKNIAVKIDNKQIRCQEIDVPGYNSECGANEVVVGFDSNGLICDDPCEEPPAAVATVACPEGQTGELTYTTNFSCETRTWSPWEQSGTCTTP